MADTGVKYPATVSTIQETGDDNDWVTPAEVISDNAVYGNITAASFDNLDTSWLLKATNPSMGVPSGATINGILVEIERHYAGGTVADYDVCLTKDGSARVGDDKSTGATFPTADAITSFGGSTDLWGTTWTVDEVNATTFGVLYKMQATANNADGFVDFIRVTVYYTAVSQTFYQNVGGASSAISGALARIATFYRSMGAASMTIVGALATALIKLQAVGGASMIIASTLSTIWTKVLSVGGGIISIAGVTARISTFYREMGQASVAISGVLSNVKSAFLNVGGASLSIAGSLATQFTAGVIAQAVGNGIVTISSKLKLVFEQFYRHEYNRVKVLIEQQHKKIDIEK